MKIFRSILVIACLFMSPLHADEFRVLDFGGRTITNGNPWMKVITNQVDWESFYYTQLHNCPMMDFLVPVDENDPCYSEPPEIDFETSKLVVGGLGAKASSAYKILISSVYTNETEQRLNIIELQEAIGLTVISYPMAAVVIGKTDKPLRINVQNAMVVE